MSAFIIRPARAEDNSGMAAVHLAAVTTGYAHIFPPDAPRPTIQQLSHEWRDAVADASTSVAVAELASTGDVIGTVAFRPDPSDSATGELRRLHVHPMHWTRASRP